MDNTSKFDFRKHPIKIATLLNAHGDSACVLDTIDSIQTYVGPDAMVLVDGAAWQSWGKDFECPLPKIHGLPHGVPRSPYRNVALGLQMLAETFSEADWYCYCEYDVLFASERFKYNLRMAEESKVWMLGNDGHTDDTAMPLVQQLIGEKFKSVYYLLGCCQFFHKDYMAKLREINFFERLLNLTNAFPEGYMPFYSGYDLSEHMYPTICRQFGGNIGVFAHYDEEGKWHGAHEFFPVRWRPELNPETEDFPHPSILHPLKTYDHPLRAKHRERRKLWKASQRKENQLV